MAKAWMVEHRSADPAFYWDVKDAELAFLSACRVKSWKEFWQNEYLSRWVDGSFAEEYISIDDGPSAMRIEIQDSYDPRKW